MIQKIKAHLRNIKSEVSEVHPLLNNLFSKMDKIQHIEYKQGPGENGADFVLIKHDDLLDTSEYIGVIVKKDGITKSSNDVLRQIDECITTPRVINGKKSIKLDEVWVITPGNITQSAQEYFQNKYSSTKIKFIGDEKLAELIMKYMPDYFIGVSAEINSYILKARERLLNLDRNSQLSFGSLTGINIEQDLIPVDKIKYKENSNVQRRPPQKTNITQVLEKKSAVLIEGGMGAGKSTLMRSTALSMLKPEVFLESKTLPIYIHFKDFDSTYQFDCVKLIESELGSIEDGINYILLLDAIDESKHDLAERSMIIDKLIEFSDSSENISIIMTARTLDEHTIKSKIKHSFRTYQISPLSLKQIVTVLEKACSGLNLKNKIIEDLKKSSLYKALPQTPIAAILLAKLLSENQQDIPSNLTELYLKYSELALGRWDLSKGLHSQKEFSVCHAVTKIIASHLIEYDLPRISLTEALDFFKDYLLKRNLGINAEELFKKMVERSDLFFVDDINKTFGFRHRTFIEFFYAQTLTDDHHKTITEECFEIYWSTINFFWVGLKKDCPEAIRAFSDVKTTLDRTRLLKIINLGNIMLAGYGSPTESIQYALRMVFIEAAKFLNDSISRKIDTQLSAFSEMQLLAIFRYFMSEAYGYEFFSSAIDNAMLSIFDDKSLDDPDRITALFLLNTAQTNPQIDKLFDSIADKNLILKAPLSIQLAIQHEAKDRNIHNDHIKKVQRNIRKILSDRSALMHIKQLYEMPLRKLVIK